MASRSRFAKCPGQFDVGNDTFEHYFDGHALLHKYASLTHEQIVCLLPRNTCAAEMSGLSYFAIQSSNFETQSKSKHSPKNKKIKVKVQTKSTRKYNFSTTKITQFFSINFVRILS